MFIKRSSSKTTHQENKAKSDSQIAMCGKNRIMDWFCLKNYRDNEEKFIFQAWEWRKNLFMRHVKMKKRHVKLLHKETFEE